MQQSHIMVYRYLNDVCNKVVLAHCTVMYIKYLIVTVEHHVQCYQSSKLMICDLRIVIYVL